MPHAAEWRANAPISQATFGRSAPCARPPMSAGLQVAQGALLQQAEGPFSAKSSDARRERSSASDDFAGSVGRRPRPLEIEAAEPAGDVDDFTDEIQTGDRKSTRLNSSH